MEVEREGGENVSLEKAIKILQKRGDEEWVRRLQKWKKKFKNPNPLPLETLEAILSGESISPSEVFNEISRNRGKGPSHASGEEGGGGQKRHKKGWGGSRTRRTEREIPVKNRANWHPRWR